MQSARVVLEHVRIIDGTGAPAAEDQNIVIAAGKIAAIQKGADVPPAAGTTILEKVQIVFKDGVGYDSQKLLDSVRGRYGQY